MKKKTNNALILGITIAIIATTSYAIITPKNNQQDSSAMDLEIPAIKPEPATISIDSPILSVKPDVEVKVEVEVSIAEAEQISFAHQIEKGESLSTIFSNLDLSKSDLHSITHASELGKQFATITPGKELVVTLNNSGQLQQLSYKKNAIETLVATRNMDSFDIKVFSKAVEIKIASAQATINSSLFLDGKEAGLSDKTIMQLADIFAWDIDFALNLRKGDQFTVVYEEKFIDGIKIDAGDIVSAEFINKGRSYATVRFKNSKGNTNYFTPKGNSMRKAFLRTPVDFARISSHFNLKRKHPVLNKIRAHKGVDYAARTGTPIKTTGDGKITFRGRKNGYGRVVIVKHGQKYSTLYAHMSKFKKSQKVGSHVKQGQIIGYVGKSGLATGAHLHYEFRINGVHRNPLTVKLPHSLPINKSLLAEFKEQTEPLIALLNQAKAGSSLLVENQQ